MFVIMLDIEAHRVRIGSFYSRLTRNRRKNVSKTRKKIGVFSEQKHPLLLTYCYQGIFITVFLLLIFLNTHFAIIKFQKLVADGIESNPGPDSPEKLDFLSVKNVKKIIHGSSDLLEINESNKAIGLYASFCAFCFSVKKKCGILRVSRCEFYMFFIHK